MRCPRCHTTNTKVNDSRASDDDSTVRRRRECNACGFRFTTYERLEATPIIIIKKNGTREPFNRDKLVNGLVKACEKRPVSLEDIEKSVDEIEFSIRNDLKKEVTSVEIGEMMVKRLKELDEVAYIRFASVYREFDDVNSFIEEINKL